MGRLALVGVPALRVAVQFLDYVFQFPHASGELPHLAFQLSKPVEYFYLLVAHNIQNLLKLLR
jgi:hypothetical protein